MSHTPGPWTCCSEEDTDYFLVENGCHCGFVVRTHHEDDARLISAAPDLLAVVEELIESASYWSEYDVPVGIVDRMKAAVQKARGI